MTGPTISVHMPVYNRERYVSKAVESILSQTFDDFEFIIIDDGSTDRSMEILEHYAKLDQRIRFFSQSNADIAKTRNKALNLATGEFFAVMDSDDVSLPSRFEKQVLYLRDNPDCVAVGCAVILIDPDGLIIREWMDCRLHEEIDKAHMEGKGGAIIHPASMIRRSVLMEIGGYSEDYPVAEDYDLFLRLGEHGRLHNLPEVLFKYRQHSDSAGYERYNTQKQLGQKALEEAYHRRGLEIPPGVSIRRGPPSKRVDNHRKWAWWALTAGNVSTARKHALTAFRLAPFSLASWRAVLCALRGY